MSCALIRFVCGERLAAGVENVDQGAFADVQTEQVPRQVAQSREGNALDSTQINREGEKVRPDRRS